MNRTIDKSNSKYIELFIRLKAAPDMLLNNLFPNAKEITESFGMFNATSELGEGYEWNNPNVVALVVGDGHKPRTAATIAFRSKWQAYSIDPMLNNHLRFDIQRLFLCKSRIEEESFFFPDQNVVILLPHSHAKLEDSIKSVLEYKRLAVITMPCCVKHNLDKKPTLSYHDHAVWSPKNLIRIWKDL